MSAVRESGSLQAVEEACEEPSTPSFESEASDKETTVSSDESDDDTTSTTPASVFQDAFHPAQSTSDWANMDAVSHMSLLCSGMSSVLGSEVELHGMLMQASHSSTAPMHPQQPMPGWAFQAPRVCMTLAGLGSPGSDHCLSTVQHSPCAMISKCTALQLQKPLLQLQGMHGPHTAMCGVTTRG